MTLIEQCIKSYFAGINEEELAQMVALFEFKTLKKGDYLVKTLQYCDNMSFVQSGLLRIFASNHDKEVTQWISTQGYFATDLASFIFHTPARWNIQALVDSEIFFISRQNYQKIATLIPKWNELEKFFLVQCFTTMENRIFSHLSLSAEERYAFFFNTNSELFNQVPLHYLASMLGMTPETLSRIRKKRLLL